MKPTDKELADLNTEMHKLCGWHYDPSRHAWHRNSYWTAEPDHYTSDRAAAMEVLEMCLKTAPSGCIHVGYAEGWREPWSFGRSKAESLPLAICLEAEQLSSE